MLRPVIAGLQLRSFAVPPVGADAAHWPLNDDRELIGYRADGLGWLTIPGVAAYRFAAHGRRRGDPGRSRRGAEIEDAFVRSVLPLVVQARGTQVLHASAVAGIRRSGRALPASRRRASRRSRPR